MYVYMYVHRCGSMRVRTHTFMFILHACLYVSMHGCVHRLYLFCLNMCVYVCLYACVCMCVLYAMHACMYARMFMYVCVHRAHTTLHENNRVDFGLVKATASKYLLGVCRHSDDLDRFCPVIRRWGFPRVNRPSDWTPARE
jgi:hypothetical protein